HSRPTRLKQGALKIESRRPELGCEISTAAEYLSGERKTAHDYEPELVAALEAKAAQNLRTEHLTRRGNLLQHAAILGSMALLLLILVLVAPGVLTAFQRTAVPFSKARYTELQVWPGNIEIPIGQSVEITNLFSGRPPADAQLHWKLDGVAQWQTV